MASKATALLRAPSTPLVLRLSAKLPHFHFEAGHIHEEPRHAFHDPRHTIGSAHHRPRKVDAVVRHRRADGVGRVAVRGKLRVSDEAAKSPA
jgi:hypothetical protein